jgi:hypothetical protein
MCFDPSNLGKAASELTALILVELLKIPLNLAHAFFDFASQSLLQMRQVVQDLL